MATTARCTFLRPLDLYKTAKPYWLFIGKPDHARDIETTNVETEIREVNVSDVRGREDGFVLDEHGFQFIKHDIAFQAFDDQARIVSEYLPRVERVIKDCIPHVTRTLVYDWRLRKEIARDDPQFVSPNQVQDREFLLAPSVIVHADLTEFTLLKRVRAELPEEADELMKGRIQMINFWKPLYDEVKNWPLIVSDARTVSMDKLVAVDQVSRRFVGDVYYATYDPDNKWYYQSCMATDEGVLFKSWDTSPDVSHKACIHSSSNILNLEPGMLPECHTLRRSIECRVLAFSSQ
ncbi:hypothetical protein QBC44DRAFT_397215 [Cladorrhinum sp. PSN332]|nr:hypothetical protein QBC44DRAFT_397215 [Cladorrhinum sp. PSN332]